jgi:serine/threonine-protein kinase
MIGTKLAHYEITSHLGTGGMGEVYQAIDTKLGRNVAIKLLPEAFTHDQDRAARFEREARVLASLNHPNIAAIYEVEESCGRKFLVMELVGGETLAERIRRSPISVEETLGIAMQITEALEAAHEKGVVHRDLKPANIKITSEGKVKVLDFGLAKAFAADVDNSNLSNSPTLSMAATNAGIIVGTAAYMSPEQARGLTADPRSDIFSFGCVLFEMLSGRQAFHGETVSDILASILKSEPDIRLLPAKLNPKTAELLRRCLEKNPKRRWHAAGDVRIEIESIIADPRGVIVEPSQAAASAPLWKRAAPLLVTAGLTAAILAGGMLYLKPQASTLAVTRFPLILGTGQQFLAVNRTLLAISLDGTQVVYVANQRLYLRLMSETEARPIPGTENSKGAVTNPVFSPDGRSLAFYSNNERAIKRIAVTGGIAVTVCPADNPFGISWGKDGILFAQGEKGILRVSEKGGEPEILVRVRKGELAQGPQMLPGEKAVLFTLASGPPFWETWDKAQIVIQVLKSGERKTLITGGSDAHYLPTGHIVYALSGDLFAIPFDLGALDVKGGQISVVEGVRRANATGAAQFSFSGTGSLIFLSGPVSSANPMTGVALLDRKKEMIEPLKVQPKAYAYPRVSPDGTRVALSVEDGGKDANVWIQDLVGSAAPRQLTLGGANRFPIWSEDGNWIAFQSDREGDLGIFRQRADGTGTVERLTRPEQGVAHIPDSWQPHSQQFAFTAVKGAEGTLRIYSIADKKETVLVQMPSAFIARSAFSHDGRWLAYQSNETGTNQIFVQPIPTTGAKYTVVNGGHPFWSQNNDELFFNSGPGQWSVVTIKTAPSFSFSVPSLVTNGLGNTAPTQFPRQADILPDGRLIGIIDPDQVKTGISTAPQINVVLNWFEELKQRMSTH